MDAPLGSAWIQKNLTKEGENFGWWDSPRVCWTTMTTKWSMEGMEYIQDDSRNLWPVIIDLRYSQSELAVISCLRKRTFGYKLSGRGSTIVVVMSVNPWGSITLGAYPWVLMMLTHWTYPPDIPTYLSGWEVCPAKSQWQKMARVTCTAYVHRIPRIISDYTPGFSKSGQVEMPYQLLISDCFNVFLYGFSTYRIFQCFRTVHSKCRFRMKNRLFQGMFEGVSSIPEISSSCGCLFLNFVVFHLNLLFFLFLLFLLLFLLLLLLLLVVVGCCWFFFLVAASSPQRTVEFSVGLRAALPRRRAPTRRRASRGAAGPSTRSRPCKANGRCEEMRWETEKRYTGFRCFPWRFTDIHTHNNCKTYTKHIIRDLWKVTQNAFPFVVDRQWARQPNMPRWRNASLVGIFCVSMTRITADHFDAGGKIEKEKVKISGYKCALAATAAFAQKTSNFIQSETTIICSLFMSSWKCAEKGVSLLPTKCSIAVITRHQRVLMVSKAKSSCQKKSVLIWHHFAQEKCPSHPKTIWFFRFLWPIYRHGQVGQERQGRPTGQHRGGSRQAATGA